MQVRSKLLEENGRDWAGNGDGSKGGSAQGTRSKETRNLQLKKNLGRKGVILGSVNNMRPQFYKNGTGGGNGKGPPRGKDQRIKIKGKEKQRDGATRKKIYKVDTRKTKKTNATCADKKRKKSWCQSREEKHGGKKKGKHRRTKK